MTSKQLLSKITLGTAQFGMDYGINNFRGKIPEKEIFQLLNLASQNKILTLDTSPLYGNSQKIIGEYLSVTENSFSLVSKLPAEDKVEVFKECQKTLFQLNITQIDGYLVHNFQHFTKFPDLWYEMEKIKQNGLTKKIGFSLYYPSELEYLLKNNFNFDIIQIPYSIFDQRFADFFPVLKQKKIEIHVRSVFLQGLLLKNPDQLTKNFLSIKLKLKQLQNFIADSQIPVPAGLLLFALLNKNINKVIIGVDSYNHLKENISYLSFANKVQLIYDGLESFKEENENIILPTLWK